MKKVLPANPSHWIARAVPALLAATLMLGVFAGCNRHRDNLFLGYVEGDYLYIGAPLAGRVESLAVEKGAQVAVGAPLFVLERSAEQAALAETSQRLAQARARLDDLRKGQRPSELAAISARLAQARSAAELSASDLARTEQLHRTGVLADDSFDRARLTHTRNQQAVTELEAQLATAQLGARSDALAAAEADVAAAEAAETRARWSVDQKQVAAPAAAVVFDVLFRPGEFVPAGQPVVSLLPPANLKVRFYVPEGELAALKLGQTIRVTISGVAQPLEAQVSFISPQAEFTPPVIYSRENRAKLVFLAEARVAPAIAATLHPGQPVEVVPVAQSTVTGGR
jgi:HlyD family secretion protein